MTENLLKHSDTSQSLTDAFSPRPHPDALAPFKSVGSAMGYADDVFDIIDRVWLFDKLRADEVGRLCARMECYTAKSGQALMEEGKDGDFLVIVISGTVEVLKEFGGSSKSLATLSGGAVLGEMSVIDGSARFATCVALEDVTFAVLTKDALHDLIITQSDLGAKVALIVAQTLARRLRETSMRLLPLIAEVSI